MTVHLIGTGRHRRPPLIRYWQRFAVLLVAIASGLITGAFIATVQRINS